ncbi:hypothetical protein [Streptomyces sioyaensis]|uniref:hypothetical protein n=1 Tax=Streptomyces sioyaensis TaxID=67364 RepID=UPI0037A38DBB
MQQLANWCAKDASCALNGQDVKAVVRQLFTRADAGKLAEPGPHGPTRKKVTADQLASFLSDYLGKWNPETTAQQLAALRSGEGKVYWTAGTPEVAWRTVICRDHDFRLPDYAHYRALLKQAAARGLGECGRLKPGEGVRLGGRAAPSAGASAARWGRVAPLACRWRWSGIDHRHRCA